MEILFILVRLPVFLIGVVLWTGYLFVATPFVVGWFLLLNPLLRFLGAPFVLVGSALFGRAEDFRSYMEKTGKEWVEAVSTLPADLADLSNTYGGMWRWLLSGSNKN